MSDKLMSRLKPLSFELRKVGYRMGRCYGAAARNHVADSGAIRFVEEMIELAKLDKPSLPSASRPPKHSSE